MKHIQEWHLWLDADKRAIANPLIGFRNCKFRRAAVSFWLFGWAAILLYAGELAVLSEP